MVGQRAQHMGYPSEIHLDEEASVVVMHLAHVSFTIRTRSDHKRRIFKSLSEVRSHCQDTF